MSIVRIGLAETKMFAEGYQAIFGGKKPGKGAKPARAKKVGAKKAQAMKAQAKATRKKRRTK